MPELHSRYGYSAVSTYRQCPHRYRLQYIDGVQMIPSDDPQNALIIGTAVHLGIEKDVETAVKWYFDQYPVITDAHVAEEIKMRHWIPQVKALLPADAIHETTITDKHFIGTADVLIPTGCDRYALYDFKYSNNVDRYLDSEQLHLYKYYLEKTKRHTVIDELGYIFIPKIQIKQKKTETVKEYRQRLIDQLRASKLIIKTVDYDPRKVIDHLETCQDINADLALEKCPSRLCDWCNYRNLCLKGDEIEMLPSIERVQVDTNNYKKIYIYGAPFSGKSTASDTAPTPLNLNTDGNVKQLTMPRLAIKDTMDGRQKVKAWEVFKNAVDDLEKGSDFETVVVDLLEDVFDYCRMYVCEARGWEHESDDSFKAYEIVRNEFLREIRRLVNLPYNIILISHEDTSKDITKRGGDKVTAIKPNIADKVATKIAGMVDIVLRAEKDGDSYTLSTKTNSVIFGGGRLSGLKAMDIPNTWDAIVEMYESANVRPNVEETTTRKSAGQRAFEKAKAKLDAEKVQPDVEETTTPKRRTRRTRS